MRLEKNPNKSTKAPWFIKAEAEGAAYAAEYPEKYQQVLEVLREGRMVNAIMSAVKLAEELGCKNMALVAASQRRKEIGDERNNDKCP